MTGAGAASLAFVKANGFLSIPGTPTYYSPGRDPTIESFTLSNETERLDEPGKVEAVESVAGPVAGEFTVSFGLSNDVQSDVHDVVFNDAGTGFTFGQAALSRWFIGSEYLDPSGGTTSTVERELRGCIPTDYSVSYSQEENTVRGSITFQFAEEVKNTTITPGSITGPTDGSVVPFHGADLTINASTVGKLQSAELTISNISRFHRDPDRVAEDAVLAAPEISFDSQAVYETDDYLELGYGASGSTQTQDTLNSVSGSFTLNTGGGTTVADYSFSKMTAAEYEWSDPINSDTDLTDPVTWDVNGSLTVS